MIGLNETHHDAIVNKINAYRCKGKNCDSMNIWKTSFQEQTYKKNMVNFLPISFKVDWQNK
jgi:hypothetical protein